MGHVDHGKTSLLDAIRKTNVVAGEAGGITQHIGAYQVTAQSGQKITFLDTPGHAAFTAMRARGAKVTDIVVLVVAADDGVMPQTVEAISHAKAAGCRSSWRSTRSTSATPIPTGCGPNCCSTKSRSKTMGGDTLDVEVSATKSTNLDKLLEAILLQAELLDLKANPNRPAEGAVIEAKLDHGRGPVATVLVQRGTLKHRRHRRRRRRMGPRARAASTTAARTSTKAGPSTPVEVLGLSAAAGSRRSLRRRRERSARPRSHRISRPQAPREAGGRRGARGSLDQMMKQLKTRARKEFPLVIKGDVQGSVEAIVGSLDKLGTDEVGARVLHAGVGGITESDVTLAQASKAVDHRLQCPRQQAGARPRPSATASRSATTTSSTISSTT